jgi:hypothetical protein
VKEEEKEGGRGIVGMKIYSRWKRNEHNEGLLRQF